LSSHGAGGARVPGAAIVGRASLAEPMLVRSSSRKPSAVRPPPWAHP
jgi:hypothetical protein